jgi:hypothetical protein
VVGSGTTAGIFGNRFYLAAPGDNTDSSGDLNDGGPWYGLGYSVDTGLTSHIQLASYYGLSLKTGGSSIVMNGGNVGIGTTNPSSYTLQVSGTIGASSSINSALNTNANGGYFVAQNLNAGSSATSSMQFQTDTGSAWIFKNSSTRTTDGGVKTCTFRNDDGDLKLAGASDSPFIYLKSSNGNVGIGTASPVEALDVRAGSITMGTYNTTGGTSRYVGLYNLTTGNSCLAGMEIESTTLVGNYSQKLHFRSHHFATSHGRRMTISEAGNVGIGTENPSYPLHVASSVTSGTVSGRWFNLSGGLNGTTQTFITSIYSAASVMTSDVFVAISDKRAKVLEEPPSESYMDLVDKIQVHQYSWINKIEKGERKKIGFFAQEVEEVVPDAVGQTTGVIPAIYRQANAFTETTITVTNHGITTEKKLEVVDPENGKTKIDIVRVIDADTLEVKFEKKPKDKLFVVGPEVDDLRAVNHDYLMAVSFGAVKELIEDNKSLRNQISRLTSRLDALVDKLK